MARAYRAPGTPGVSAQGDEARERALAAALLARARVWQAADARAHRFAHGRSEDVTDAVRLAEDYRLLAHDLARKAAVRGAAWATPTVRGSRRIERADRIGLAISRR